MNDFRDFLIPFVHPLPVIGDNSSRSGQKTTELVSGKMYDAVKVCTPCLFVMIDTSHRKKSECFLSDALFTNSLNGRVLWGKEAQLRNPQRQRADGRFSESVQVCVRAHLYTKFLRRKSICGTVDTWILTSLSPPFCRRYSTVHLSRQGPSPTPLSTAGLRCGEQREDRKRYWRHLNHQQS